MYQTRNVETLTREGRSAVAWTLINQGNARRDVKERINQENLFPISEVWPFSRGREAEVGANIIIYLFFPSLAGRVLLVTSQTAASTLKYSNMASSYKAEPSTLSSLRSSSSRRGLFHGKTHLTTNPSAHLRAFSFEEKKFGLWHQAPFVSQNHKKKQIVKNSFVKLNFLKDLRNTKKLEKKTSSRNSELIKWQASRRWFCPWLWQSVAWWLLAPGASRHRPSTS